MAKRSNKWVGVDRKVKPFRQQTSGFSRNKANRCFDSLSQAVRSACGASLSKKDRVYYLYLDLHELLEAVDIAADVDFSNAPKEIPICFVANGKAEVVNPTERKAFWEEVDSHGVGEVTNSANSEEVDDLKSQLAEMQAQMAQMATLLQKKEA